jgi:hypothetical protein
MTKRHVRNPSQFFCTDNLMTNSVDIPQFLFATVARVLPSAVFKAVWHKKKTRYHIEITGFHLVAGARFELTTFRL